MERKGGDAGDLQTDQQDGSAPQGQNTTFTGGGMIPPFMAFPQGGVQAKSASDIAFGVGPEGPKHDHAMPVDMNEAAMKAQVAKSDAERLLKTKDVCSPQDAQKALELLLTVDPAYQTKVIDELDDHAFENLVDRLTVDQKARMKLLVDASQKPKRKLRLWAAEHMGRARTDLMGYQGNFGTEDDRTDEQQAAKDKYDRRERGVKSTQEEVNAECKKLLAKGDKLTVADIDAMRERKDEELRVEMKHNINLVAQDEPRLVKSMNEDKVDERNPDVVWSASEATHLDRALDKLPVEHRDGAKSNETYKRKSFDNWLDSKGGLYDESHDEEKTRINIFDGAHTEDMSERGNVDPVEYSVIHEVGHDVASDNKAAFKKFEKVAGWKNVHAADLEQQGFTQEKIDNPNKGQNENGKVIHQYEGKDLYAEVDETAVPSVGETGGDRWKYAANNSNEHFAEMYAMAVEDPQALYTDYVQHPADEAQKLRAKVREQQRAVDSANSADRPRLAANLAQSKQDLVEIEKLAKQRRELFDIIRNDIFHADKGTAAAVGRLKQNGVGADAIRIFEEKAAQVSTPLQIQELEAEAKKK